MEVYIDKENLRSFIRARNDSRYKDCYDDCYRMLKRQLHINYNFSKTRELLEDEELKNYFMLSGQGNGDSEADTYSTEVFPSRHVGMSTPRSFNRKHSSAVYLIDDEGVDSFREVGTSLVGDVNEEVSVLKRLFCTKNGDFDKIYFIQDDFHDWTQIQTDKLNLPLSDIIIFDRYIGTNLGNSSNNILKLLKILVKDVCAKIDVVIVSDEQYYNRYKQSMESPDWERFRRTIKQRIEEETTCDPNVTIVFMDDSYRPHDRRILTNYMMFTSGDSFSNYFRRSGEIATEGDEFVVYSLANKNHYQFAMKKINELSENLAGRHIIGDKKSNYIRFSE